VPPGACPPRAGQNRVDVIGQAAGDAEQAVALGGAVMGHGGLHQVPGTVQLVHVADVGPALRRALEAEIGVEVAAGLLGGRDKVDGRVDHAGKVRRWIGSQGPGGSFQPFVDVAVVENSGPERDGCVAGGAAKVVEAAGLSRRRYWLGMVTSRLMHSRGAQNWSVRVTAVRGTGLRRAEGLCEVSTTIRDTRG